ncbi:MAG: hypothetical protein WC080_02775 [Patescibacteria group bacterium]|jgi:hypothetical protein
MKLIVRGFKKETLKKFKDVKSTPLCALSPKNQKNLGVCKGKSIINGLSAIIIDGSIDQFIGMTKTLRQNLNLEIGQEVEASLQDSVLKINRI